MLRVMLLEVMYLNTHRWWPLTEGVVQESRALIQDRSITRSALQSSVAFTKSLSSTELLFSHFTAAQLVCCRVLGGQCLTDGPQQGLVTALGFHMVWPQSPLEIIITTALKLICFEITLFIGPVDL